MGCGCSKGHSVSATSVPSVYIFTNPSNGRQESFPSMYEAKFAQLKAGGGGNIRVEAKT